jgi:c-di-GMP phosphodiesterase
MMQNVFIARQPIYNRKLQVEGYGLLSRSSNTDCKDPHDDERTTAAVLRKLFQDIGIGQLVGDKKAFVNLSRQLLLSDDMDQYRHEKLVFELPNDLQLDVELCKAIREQREQGAWFAVDNFVYDERWKPVLDCINYIKINVQAEAVTSVTDQVRKLKDQGLQLLALRVESQEIYASCHDLGFDLFQGSFFCRPELIRGRKMATSRVSTMRLLAQLQSPDSSLKELERIISQDVSLSYRLLRYLNSVQFSLVSKIESINHAISYLGLDNLRVWVSILLLAKIDEKPVELMHTALIRGKMCEQLGLACGHQEVQSFFMAGLFSTLEAFLDTPINDIIKDLPLSETLQKALLSFAGSAGEALRCTLAYERGDWASVVLAPYSDEVITQAYLKAVAWSEETIGEIVG